MANHCLSAADWRTVPEEVFDNYTPPTDWRLEPRPRDPPSYDVWARQARNEVHAFSCVYGMEYFEYLTEALQGLCDRHEADGHRWPLEFIKDASDEFFFHRTEVVRARVRAMVRTLGREVVRKEDLEWVARAPRPDGQPHWEAPDTFNLEDEAGYFKQVIVKRLEKATTRHWWDQVHLAKLRRAPEAGAADGSTDGPDRGPPKAGVTGGEDQRQRPRLESSSRALYLAGKNLAPREQKQALEHAPMDSKGRPKCWDAACHITCRRDADECPRSHEGIRSLEGLHWTVQAQPIRRGGLRTQPRIDPKHVDCRVEQLRVQARSDRAEKISDGVARAKAVTRRPAEGAARPKPKQGAAGPGRAGGWQGPPGLEPEGAPAPPAEYRETEFTAAEADFRGWMDGPSQDWGRDHARPAAQEAAVEPAADAEYTARLAAMASVDAEPQAAALDGAPPRLQAYARSRMLGGGGRHGRPPGG